jgi:hypothetical protein
VVIRRLRLSVALIALLAPSAAQCQSDPALWRFVYPNAKALISIDWARIRQSQAGAMIREKWLTVSGTPMPAIPGIELLNDIDRILISSPGNKSPDESAQPPVLIAIHGHFDPAKVREIFTRFGAKPQAYNSFQVYRTQGKQAKDMACVLFDGETILFGDAPSIFAALDRNQFGTPPQQPGTTSGSMMARAEEMEAGYDFWVIMDATEILSNDSVAALFRGGEWASEARGFEAGVSLRSGLAADITVRFSSDATAKRMTTELTRVVNLAAKDKSTGAQVQDIAKKLKFIADGSATKISLRMTQQDMEKSAQAFAASRQASAQLAGKRASSANLTPAPTPIATPPKPAVIRIEGLDDGPREIPYQDPRH